MKKDLTPKKLEPGAGIEEISEAYNDLTDKFEYLSTKLSLLNFDGQILEVALAAGEEKKVPHNLGVKPNYCVILSQSGNGVISDGPLKSAHYIILKNNGSIATKAKILLLKE